MMVNVRKKAEHISEGCENPLYDATDSDSKMSTENFDDAVAALTFAATVITIALGFLFNL
jgi:hypothetical protein